MKHDYKYNQKGELIMGKSDLLEGTIVTTKAHRMVAWFILIVLFIIAFLMGMGFNRWLG